MFAAPPNVENEPRPRRVYVETYGCSFNVSDGEVIAGLLERDGFELVESASEADAVVVNSCTVKDRTWLDLKKRLGELEQQGPAVVLAGCAPKVPQQSRQLEQWSQLGPNNLAQAPEVVRQALAGNRVQHLDIRHDETRLELPAKRRNRNIEILPISKGCLGSCTFCQTVIARGRLRSFPAEQIIARIQQAVAKGVTQVWLTSQDCGAYGLDCGTNLPALMRKIAALPGDFIVRVGMANPDLIKLYTREFAEILAHPRFYQFAHIPLQAGDNQVLADMRRLYTVEDFFDICDKLRQASPRITIATDIIAGFPTESDEQFERTLEAIQRASIPVVNRSRFSPRQGTPAARLKQLPSKVIAERSKRLYATACEIAFRDLDGWADFRGSVHVEEHLHGRGAVMARNDHYKPVILKGDLSARALVQATGRERFHLHAEVIASC